MAKEPDKAMKTAKALQEKWNELQQQATRRAHEDACGDSFGPCMQDWKDADEWFTRQIAEIVRKGMT